MREKSHAYSICLIANVQCLDVSSSRIVKCDVYSMDKPLINALRWSGLNFFAVTESFSAERMLPARQEERVAATNIPDQYEIYRWVGSKNRSVPRWKCAAARLVSRMALTLESLQFFFSPAV
jgi:hypothetical protein